MSSIHPLTVSADNPRYLTPRSGGPRAVYLTGSHIWNNFHDGMGPAGSPPKNLDYSAYLDSLADRGHNFVRLWRWEHFRSQAAGGAFNLDMTLQPWVREGESKFDLSRFDPAYFERLRARVEAAGERGMYVAVMLFDGWALHLSRVRTGRHADAAARPGRRGPRRTGRPDRHPPGSVVGFRGGHGCHRGARRTDSWPSRNRP